MGAWGGLAFAAVATVGSYVEEPYVTHKNTTISNCSNFETIEPIPEDP